MLFAAFDVDTEWCNHALLTVKGFAVSTGKPTDNLTVKYLNKRIISVLYKFLIYFF